MVALQLRSSAIARWSAAAGLGLVGLHSLVAVLGLAGVPVSPRVRGLVEIRGELNLPAWFSAMQLLFAAVLAALVGRGDRGPANARGSGWYTLAGLIALHAVDEACNFHERIAPILPPVLGGTTAAQQWLLIGGAVSLGFLAWFAPLLRRLHADARRAFLLAGLVYYGGAAVLGALAMLVETGGHSTRFLAMSTLAETAELAGMTTLLYAIVRHQELTTGAVPPTISS